MNSLKSSYFLKLRQIVALFVILAISFSDFKIWFFCWIISKFEHGPALFFLNFWDSSFFWGRARDKRKSEGKTDFERSDVSIEDVDAVEAGLAQSARFDLVGAVDDQRRDHRCRHRTVVGDGADEVRRRPHRRHARRRHRRFTLDVGRGQTVDAFQCALAETNPIK